jgi:hypothetical protein
MRIHTVDAGRHNAKEFVRSGEECRAYTRLFKSWWRRFSAGTEGKLRFFDFVGNAVLVGDIDLVAPQ